jgi:hypothetical protein
MLKKLIFIGVLSSASIGFATAQSEGVNIDKTATNNQQLSKIELYPNPAVDYIMIEIFESGISNIQFELRSMIGNRIEVEFEEIELNKYRIQLEDFASGYYFLVIRDDFNRYKKAYKFLKN